MLPAPFSSSYIIAIEDRPKKFFVDDPHGCPSNRRTGSQSKSAGTLDVGKGLLKIVNQVPNVGHTMVIWGLQYHDLR